MDERAWWSRKGGVRGSKHSIRRGSKEKFDHDTLLGAANKQSGDQGPRQSVVLLLLYTDHVCACSHLSTSPPFQSRPLAHCHVSRNPVKKVEEGARGPRGRLRQEGGEQDYCRGGSGVTRAHPTSQDWFVSSTFNLARCGKALVISTVSQSNFRLPRNSLHRVSQELFSNHGKTT